MADVGTLYLCRHASKDFLLQTRNALMQLVVSGLVCQSAPCRHISGAPQVSICDHAPGLQVRFAKHVFPGETLETQIWVTSSTACVFQTRVLERDAIVLQAGGVTFREGMLKAPAQQPRQHHAHADSSSPSTAHSASAASPNPSCRGGQPGWQCQCDSREPSCLPRSCEEVGGAGCLGLAPMSFIAMPDTSSCMVSCCFLRHAA